MSFVSSSGAIPTAALPPFERFVAFDISKRTSVVAAVDTKQQIVLSPRKVVVEKLEQWASTNLKSTDKVVIEATFNAWYYYDLLKPLVGAVVVANPHQVKLIAHSRVKTDARDALALAKLLAADLIPTVWVPPAPVRELRNLIAYRQRLIRQAASAKNRLHAILATQHLLPPGGDPFSAKYQGWWQELKLPQALKLMIKGEMSVLEALQPLIANVEKEIIELSNQGQWASQSGFLIQLPGIGVLTAMTILSAIGDVKRFESAKKLVGYSGLGASIHASGQLVRRGGITKEGRRELRTALVEAAWTAVEHDEKWKSWFERLALRIGRGKAIVAVARKLVVVIWHVLSKGEADRQAQEEPLARKMLRWAYKLRARGRNELSGPAFTRLQLSSLGVGQKLNEFKYDGRLIRLPPP